MRNLRTVRHEIFENEPRRTHVICAWDTTCGGFLCASGPEEDNCVVELQRWRAEGDGSGRHKREDITSWDAPCPLPDLPCDKVLDLHFFAETLTACLVFAGGDLVVVREKPLSGEDRTEIVGSVETGIAAAAWSPDEELLAIATRDDVFLLMTRDFHPATEIQLSTDDLDISRHVSVGWGKSETQFKGKGARALRDPTMPEKVDEGLFSVSDDRSATISWRGDGNFVAVNSPHASSRRIIRIYSREGALDSVTEPVDFMEAPLSWRPAGNLLAATQRLEDSINVIFFERNGLRHGQFSLRMGKTELEQRGTVWSLDWNEDSSILAVTFADRIQLWTMGNYHYYLKQEIIASEGRRYGSRQVVWHPEQPQQLLLSLNGVTHGIELMWHVCRASTSQPSDFGAVAVVDGAILKLTPLRFANIPPPMALHELSLDHTVRDVAFWDIGSSNIRIATLGRDHLTIYSWDLRARPIESPKKLFSANLSHLIAASEVSGSHVDWRQIEFQSHESLLLLGSAHGYDLVSQLNVGKEAFQAQLVQRLDQVVRGIFGVLSEHKSPSYLWCQDDRLLRLSEVTKSAEWKTLLPGQETVELKKHTESIEIVSPTEKASDDAQVSNGTETRSFALQHLQNGHLYAGDRILVRDCTSFLTTPSHIILTTSQHLLKFIEMVEIQELDVPPDTPESDERCRSIERGARLITAIPSTSAVVLQMPRGNLETVYPRAMVLAGVRRYITRKQYKKAFLACRNHRVDMNIIYDYSPVQFLSNVKEFVGQVQKRENIDLFLSSLRDEDVTKTMYKGFLSAKSKGMTTGPATKHSVLAPTESHSKVNTICDTFLDVLGSRPDSDIQNIITAHVCKLPPDLEAGLREVSKFQHSNPERARVAVEHICFLVDVNRLFDASLGLYDLDLTLVVARQSQKDPREYVPFVDRLRTRSQLRMQFEIDDHLKRYKKALSHLRELQVFDEFKTYVERHNLYEEALKICRYQEQQVKEIMLLHAEYLASCSKHREAGIAFEYVKDYTRATECYRLAHMWQEALSSAGLASAAGSESNRPDPDLALALVDSLTELKDYRSAAVISLDHLSDVDAAARLFCKGYHFGDAARVLTLHGRTDLLEPVLDGGLIACQAAMTQLLAECTGQLEAQVPRLRELRAKKAEEPSAFYDGDGGGGGGGGGDADAPDNISLAPTDASTVGSSLFTRYTDRTGTGTLGTNATRRTSKNRRREERKRARGKKGSVYEEEYLVNSIGRLIERVNGSGEDAEKLVVGLMRRGMRERARAVETAMLKVKGLCTGCVEEVFDRGRTADRAAVGGSTAQGAEEEEHSSDRPAGGAGILWESARLMESKLEPPIIKAYERLSIVGS